MSHDLTITLDEDDAADVAALTEMMVRSRGVGLTAGQFCGFMVRVYLERLHLLAHIPGHAYSEEHGKALLGHLMSDAIRERVPLPTGERTRDRKLTALPSTRPALTKSITAIQAGASAGQDEF